VALALFGVPALLLVPVKLGALWMIQQGQPLLGVAIIVVAKVLGTALVGRLFVLVEPQLMTFAWFVRCAAWWRATRDRVKSALRQSFVWRAARLLTRVGRESLRRLAAYIR